MAKKTQKPVESAFDSRFAQYSDELKWLFCELYNNDMQAYDYFCDMLRKSYEERKDALRKIDEARLADPEWYRSNKLLGMMLYVPQFAGTLQGVQKKLPYLEECGVNYLHLMPLLKSPKGRDDGGYAVADFRTVQPELGTMDDLEALADEAHKKGICLCLDFVMNHTSEDHEWAQAARQGDPSARARYYFYDNWDIPNQYEKDVPQVFPTTAPGNFTWFDDCKQVVMTTFYPYQWDLNYANPMVFNDMMENLLYLTNRGIDVIRLDAVPYIWKQLGTNCRNLPQVHSLCRMMHLACQIVCPSVLLLGEVVMEPSKLAPYFGTTEKPECHMLYNATTMCTTWHTLATRDISLLSFQMDQLNALPHEYMFQNYLRCHDDIGWGLDFPWLTQFGIDEVAHKKYLNDFYQGYVYGSKSRGELYNDDPRLGDARMCGTTASLCGTEAAVYEDNAEALQRSIDCDIMLHAWVFTQSGIPVLYSGDEIGQLNDYSYHEDPDKASDSRYLHRGNFDWELAEYRKDASTRQGQLFQALRTLEKIRAAEPIFRADADVYTYYTGSNHIFGLKRIYNGEEFVGLFNFSEYDFNVYCEDEFYTNLITGEKLNLSEIHMKPFGFYWLKK
ncbi:MAG: alpha-amylase family protein [Lachnospiraceae bacterium]|nr:alpha-amylase family protein [Lachnospiraceae bacterium]